MGYLGNRLLHIVPVMLAVTVITFGFIYLLPGDVTYSILGDQATPDLVAELQEELGLKAHPVLRYFRWMGGVLQGDFGRSFITQEKVTDAIVSRLPVTLELMVLTQLLALLLSVPLAVYSAYRAGGVLDRATTGVTFGLLSVPNFLMAIILIFTFAVYFNILPASGFTPLSEGLWANLRSLALPALTLGLIEFCALSRVLRADMIATLQEEYILTAKAKGLPIRRILFVHALKPSSFTVITLFAINVGSLISGSLVVETVFALPGIGRLLVNAIYTRDFIMVQGVVLFASIIFVMVNLAADLFYAALDPRIHHERA
ncbi:MAG: ABC transporter permease [bacterium]